MAKHFNAPWGNTLTLTGLAASMAVNALVTGLIVFKILKVFLEVKAKPSYFGRANIGLIELNRGYQTSAYHIHNNRIRYGVVCHPTGSRRAFLPAICAGTPLVS
jgi:hypothetical protein